MNAKAIDEVTVTLTPDEIAFVMNELAPDHDGSDFEAECPSCTAYRKLKAASGVGVGAPSVPDQPYPTGPVGGPIVIDEPMKKPPHPTTD